MGVLLKKEWVKLLALVLEHLLALELMWAYLLLWELELLSELELDFQLAQEMVSEMELRWEFQLGLLLELVMLDYLNYLVWKGKISSRHHFRLAISPLIHQSQEFLNLHKGRILCQ